MNTSHGCSRCQMTSGGSRIFVRRRVGFFFHPRPNGRAAAEARRRRAPTGSDQSSTDVLRGEQ